MPSNLTVRLDDITRTKLELIAQREYRPLAGQINYFVQKGIEAYLYQNDLVFEHSQEDGSLFLMSLRNPYPAPPFDPSSLDIPPDTEQ